MNAPNLTRRASLWSALALAACLALPAPSPAQADPGVLRIVASGGLNSGAPAHAAGNLLLGFLGNAFETLTVVTPEGELLGNLAESWEPLDGGATWRFTLKQGITFSDGTPFDAAAVARNISYLLTTQKPVPTRGGLGTINGASVVDTYTVDITAKAPFTGMPIWLSNAVFGIVSPKALDELGEGHDLVPVAGTGPYMVTSVAIPDTLVMERNPSWRGEPAPTPRLEFQFISNDQTRVATMLGGDADVNFYLLPTDIPRLRANGGVDVVTAASIRSYIVHLPMSVPAIQDKRVREALNLAIDRQAIIDNIFDGYATMMDTSVGPAQVGYRPVAPLPYDPERAAALFAEAGWTRNADGILEKDGSPFPTIIYHASNGRYPSDVALSQAVTGYLTAAGVPVQLQSNEFGVFMADAREKAAKEGWMTQIAWGFATESAAMLCQVYYPEAVFDFGAYDDPVLNESCRAINAELDLAKRTQMVGDAAAHVYGEFGAIFLVATSYIMGVREGVEGVRFSPVEFHRFETATVAD